MNYDYTKESVDEITNSHKCLESHDKLAIHLHGDDERNAKFEEKVLLIDGGFIDMRYLGKAPRIDEIATFDTAFILAGKRVRGIGYHPIGRSNPRHDNFIPQGWHQNICDPNLPASNPLHNIHAPLEEFEPTDFNDFITKTAKIWKIDLGWEWDQDLFS